MIEASGPHYLNHVYPLSNIEEALLTGDVVQQQHAVRPPEIRLCDAAEPDGRKRVVRRACVEPLIIKVEITFLVPPCPTTAVKRAVRPRSVSSSGNPLLETGRRRSAH